MGPEARDASLAGSAVSTGSSPALGAASSWASLGHHREGRTVDAGGSGGRAEGRRRMVEPSEQTLSRFDQVLELADVAGPLVLLQHLHHRGVDGPLLPSQRPEVLEQAKHVAAAGAQGGDLDGADQEPVVQVPPDRPEATSAERSRLVVATSRKSAGTGSVEPTGS